MSVAPKGKQLERLRSQELGTTKGGLKFTDTVAPLPRVAAASLLGSLKSLHRRKVAKVVYRNAMLKAMVEIMKQARKHTSYLIDNTPVFNKEAALKALPEEEAYFFSRFYDTQHFQFFL